MTDIRTTTDAMPPSARSRVANGTRLLEGLDLRTRPGRRLRDAMASLAAEFSLETESEMQRALEAASLIVWLEAETARQVRGDPVDMRQMSVVQKLMGGHRKAFEAIRRRRARNGVAA